MSYLNDFIKPTDYGAVRKDINRILALIHDITAQEPEDEGLQERITVSSNVKLRTSNITTGSPTVTDTDTLYKENFIFRKSIKIPVSTYDLIHTTTGTLTFDVSNTKYGGAGTFDGSSYITIDDHINMNVDNISFGGWFYLPATDAGDTASQNLLYKGVSYSLNIDPHSTASNQIRASSVKAYTSLSLTTESDTSLETENNLSIEGDYYADVELTGTFTPNAWNHIWYTKGDNDVKLYINNVLTDNDTIALSLTDVSDDLIIG
jgi:hypothetical protein